MVQKKLLVVLGATGGQGGSVVDALLKTHQYNLRGTTRYPCSKEAQSLARRGVEVVEANLDDPQSLTSSLANAHVIFAVTKMVAGDMDREIMQGKHIADAAARVESLEHFIWSTLPSASTVSGGKCAVPHMDGKAEVDEYIINSLPALARITTFLWGGFYAENVQYPNFAPNFLATAGKYVWVQPVGARTLVPMVGDHSVNVGIFVERVLARPETCLPMKYVLAVTEWMTNGELLRLWAKVVGEVHGKEINTVYIHSDLHTVDQLWPEIGKEMGLLLKVLEEFGEKAWTKSGVELVTLQDLELEVGEGETNLMSMEKSIRKMARKFCSVGGTVLDISQ
jgi:NmrA-like family